MRRATGNIPDHLRVTFRRRWQCRLLWTVAASDERAGCLRIAWIGGTFNYHSLRIFRSKVQYVYLRSLPFYDGDVELISNCNCCEILELSGTQITDESVLLLGKMKQLNFLGLRETGITKRGIYRLKESLPTCLIIGGEQYWYGKMVGQQALQSWAEHSKERTIDSTEVADIGFRNG